MSNRLIFKAASFGLALGVILCASAIAAPPSKAPARKPAPQKGGGGGSNNNGALTAAFNAYLDQLRVKLDKNWYVADGKNHVTLSVNVASDGGATGLELTSSPSDTKAEQAASDAFNGAQPLSALPSGVESVKLTLTFDSTADPHGDSNRSIGAKVENVALQGSKPAN